MSSSSKKPKKRRLDDAEAKVKPPWEAWHHPTKNRTFYINSVTKESIWEHPDDRESQKKREEKRKNISRKRKDEEKSSEVEEEEAEKMEVDAPPAPKRKSVERSDDEPRTSKRVRQTGPERAVPEPEIIQIEEKIVEDDVIIESVLIPQFDRILPLVAWSSEIRGFHQVPYRACAIFDTCALIQRSEALDLAVNNQILTVIPYAVLSELDGLKNAEQTRREANRVSSRLKSLQEHKNRYLHVETSSEQQIRLLGYHSNESFKDDLILKCALRLKAEVLSISATLNLNDRAVLLVTNDSVLSNKALAHEMTTETVDDFVDIVTENPRKPEKPPPQRQRERKSEEPRKYDSYVAVQQVKKTRAVQNWISEMATSDGNRLPKKGKDGNATMTKKSTNPLRPSIPLADEFAPTEPRKTSRSSAPPPSRSSWQNRNPSKSDNSIRAKMPCSLSDEEEDGMDCS